MRLRLALTILAACLLTELRETTDKRSVTSRISIADVMRLRSVVEAAISPNGATIAYIVAAADETADIGCRKLYFTNIATHGVVSVTGAGAVADAARPRLRGLSRPQ
jgi:hypothetical protein